MTIYFSKTGLELKKDQIKISENKIKTLQKEAADAAGVSYDWHDNFGCEEATRQAEAESAFLAKLKEETRNAKIIEPEEQNQKILIGTTVKLLTDGKEREFTIGAYGETDPANGLISYTSPLASGLLDMQVGDTKTVTIGNKNSVVAIKEIFPPSYRYSKIIERLSKSTNK
jgi:transcription elongation GreA/GreB family factor